MRLPEMKLPLFHLLVPCLCVPFLFSSCGTTGGGSSPSSSSNVPVEEMTGYFEESGTIPGHLLKWEDNPSVPGKLLVVVDKKKQMMYVYRGTHRIAYAPISSGRSSGMTPSGYFRIASKDADHHSYYGAFINAAGELRDGDIRKDAARPGERFEPAKMPYFMRVNGAVGIHEGYLPGRPSSHGCIRIPHLVAKNLFEVAPVGTRVIVRDGDWNIHELQKKPSGIFRTVENMSRLGLANVRVVPRTTDVWRGINTLRELLERSFFHARTQERVRGVRGEEEPGGVEHLELYRSRPPGAGGSVVESPVHDGHSHTADAARTFAEAWSHGLLHGPGNDRGRGRRARMW